MKTKKLIALGVAAFLATVTDAQLTLTGTNYFQNFNTISNGLPAGWSVRTNGTATTLGTAATFPTAGKTWSDTTGEFGNCASTGSNAGTNFNGGESPTIQGNCTNRAPAIRQTGSFGDPGAAFVLSLANTLGMANFQLSLDFLMLNVQTRSNVWTVDYAVGTAPANFTPLATYTNSRVFGGTHTDISLGTALDGKGSNVWIRVVALNACAGSGSRDTFGLDNFSLSWTTNDVSAGLLSITGILITNGNVRIDFTGNPDDTISSFILLGADQVAGAFSDTGATITQIGPGIFQAACALNGPQQFYRIKRQ